MDEEYLIHYGVKGMKWGVRRQRRYDKRADKLANAAKRARKSGDSVEAERLDTMFNANKRASERAKKFESKGAGTRSMVDALNRDDINATKKYSNKVANLAREAMALKKAGDDGALTDQQFISEGKRILQKRSNLMQKRASTIVKDRELEDWISRNSDLIDKAYRRQMVGYFVGGPGVGIAANALTLRKAK